jgi:hypothetical protein
MGYAHVRREPVYMLAPIQDQFLIPLVRPVVSKEELMQLVHP